MAERELAEGTEKRPYFQAVEAARPEQDDGTREMGELYPFIISGGSNTERYYFMHINDTTDYKFNIRPRYFGDESSYTEVFPRRVKEIMDVNRDAKIFCVFDWETVFGNKTRMDNHRAFVELIEAEISSGTVTLCPSMPSIEYWFLLHFVDYRGFLRDYGAAANRLAPYLKSCFVDQDKPLKKLLKMEKYLKDSTWVENLCADGKLTAAINRAEKNITAAMEAGKLDEQSYSYVYRVFKNKVDKE